MTAGDPRCQQRALSSIIFGQLHGPGLILWVGLELSNTVFLCSTTSLPVDRPTAFVPGLPCLSDGGTWYEFISRSCQGTDCHLMRVGWDKKLFCKLRLRCKLHWYCNLMTHGAMVLSLYMALCMTVAGVF